jgi:hypothetical protein
MVLVTCCAFADISVQIGQLRRCCSIAPRMTHTSLPGDSVARTDARPPVFKGAVGLDQIMASRSSCEQRMLMGFSFIGALRIGSGRGA